MRIIVVRCAAISSRRDFPARPLVAFPFIVRTGLDMAGQSTSSLFLGGVVAPYRRIPSLLYAETDDPRRGWVLH